MFRQFPTLVVYGWPRDPLAAQMVDGTDPDREMKMQTAKGTGVQ
jgi:hypothetical protein